MNYGITNYVFDKIFGTFSDKIIDKKITSMVEQREERIKILDGVPV